MVGVLVVVGLGIGAALAVFLPGPAVYTMHVESALHSPASAAVLDDCVTAVEDSLSGWVMFGAKVHDEPAQDSPGRVIELESPWWGPPTARGSAMISNALVALETKARRHADERAEALAAMQSKLDELRIRRAMLSDSPTPMHALTSATLEPLADELAQKLSRLETGIRAAQTGQSELLTEWTDLRQPTTEADLTGLDQRVADTEVKDRVLRADLQALARATNETRTQLQQALDATPPVLDALKSEIAAFVAEADDVADHSEALKTDALTIRQALSQVSVHLAALAQTITDARDQLRDIDGELVGHEIRAVQRRADNAADDWLHDSGETFAAIAAKVDALTSDASIHRTPALVAQSRFQSRLTRTSAARDAVVHAVAGFSTQQNHRLDGVMQSMLGLQLRVEDRRERIRAAIIQRLMEEAEGQRVGKLADAEDQIKPTAEDLAATTNKLLATRANLDDVHALLAQAREHEAADAERRAEADRLRLEILDLEARLEAESRLWVPPVHATLVGAERRLASANTTNRLTIAASVAGAAFILLTVLLVPFAFRGRPRATTARVPSDLARLDVELTCDDDTLAGTPKADRRSPAQAAPRRRSRSRV